MVSELRELEQSGQPGDQAAEELLDLDQTQLCERPVDRCEAVGVLEHNLGGISDLEEFVERVVREVSEFVRRHGLGHVFSFRG